MTKNIWKYIKVLLIVSFYLFSSMLFQELLTIFKIDIETLSKTTKILLELIKDLVLAFVLYIIYRKDINSNFKNFKDVFKKYFSFGIKWWVIGVVIMVGSNFIISLFYPNGASNENIIEELIKIAPIYMILTTVITGPFIEELIFRKTLREIFTNNIIYIIVCGLIFGYLHTTVGTSPMELLYIIPYGILGSVFAYMYVKTENILLPITFHMIHNFITVFFYIIALLIGVKL